nr:homeobox-DDT domain protein RLT2 isoform X1 [Tanacetum cinerariifolium]
MLLGESYTYWSHDEAIPYGNDGGNVVSQLIMEDVTTLLRNGSAAENASLLMQEKGVSQPKKPRHRLTSGQKDPAATAEEFNAERRKILTESEACSWISRL